MLYKNCVNYSGELLNVLRSASVYLNRSVSTVTFHLLIQARFVICVQLFDFAGILGIKRNLPL